MSDPLDGEIDFSLDFDFDSFVRGGRGEAARASMRRASLTLGLILGSCTSPRGGLLLYTLVLSDLIPKNKFVASCLSLVKRIGLRFE